MTKKNITSIVLFAIFAISLSCGSAEASSAIYSEFDFQVWTPELLTEGYNLRDAHIAVDHQGNVHISYYDRYPNFDLKYVTNATGSWVIETVDSEGNVGESNSIAVDSKGNVHISYQGRGRINYATKTGEAWVVEDLDRSSYVNPSSIKIDSSGSVHIIYTSSRQLKHATKVNGHWVIERVGSDYIGYSDNQYDMAIDALDKLHIIYINSSDLYPNYGLKHITNASGRWDVETIAYSEKRLFAPSIAIVLWDNAHVSYYDGSLMYSTNKSGRWVTEIADSDGGPVTSIEDGPLSTYIALDSHRKVYIGYGHKLVTNASGIWASEIMSESKQKIAIDLDSGDNVHGTYISYINFDDELLYTSRIPPVTDVKADSSDDWFVKTNEDTVSVTTSLYTGNSTGYLADWWMLADTPSGWYYYDMNLASWMPGQSVSYQGPLYEFNSLEILNSSGMPSGQYTYFFAIDTLMNGIMDSEQLFSDSVTFDITEKGRFAVDLGLASADYINKYTAPKASIKIDNENLPDISGEEFTIEAWVKNSNDDSGAIFQFGSSYYGKGIGMKLSNNELMFNITRDTSTPEPTGCVSHYPTSTSTCILSSNFQLLKDVWTHIAGVLVDEEHVHPESESCTSSVMMEKPHLDFYINGELTNCSSSGAEFIRGELYQRMTIGSDQSCCGQGTVFNGTLDEMRFWTVARSQQEIQQCMKQELSNSGPCTIDPSILKGYWNFNEGEGSLINDISGNGLLGEIRTAHYDSGYYQPWDGAWVPGYKFLLDEDGDGSPSDEDCNDNDRNNYPGNIEVCDGQDNNCNGEIDEIDSDGDGVSDCVDNCLDVPNPDQSDVDGDGIGDVCDPCDNRPITGSISPSTSTLWPPNHEMVSVVVNGSSLDIHNPDTQISITSIGISEFRRKSAGGKAGENIYDENNFEPDYMIAGDMTVDLRSERAGASQGRTYTINVTATDCSGTYNFSTQVEVPHDQGN